MAKGMRTKLYSIKRGKTGYTVTFKDADYARPGVVEIPFHLVNMVSRYDIENLLYDYTTSYYSGKIREAILCHAEEVAAKAAK